MTVDTDTDRLTQDLQEAVRSGNADAAFEINLLNIDPGDIPDVDKADLLKEAVKQDETYMAYRLIERLHINPDIKGGDGFNPGFDALDRNNVAMFDILERNGLTVSYDPPKTSDRFDLDVIRDSNAIGVQHLLKRLVGPNIIPGDKTEQLLDSYRGEALRADNRDAISMIARWTIKACEPDYRGILMQHFVAQAAPEQIDCAIRAIEKGGDVPPAEPVSSLSEERDRGNSPEKQNEKLHSYLGGMLEPKTLMTAKNWPLVIYDLAFNGNTQTLGVLARYGIDPANTSLTKEASVMAHNIHFGAEAGDQPDSLQWLTDRLLKRPDTIERAWDAGGEDLAEIILRYQETADAGPSDQQDASNNAPGRAPGAF